VVSVEWVAMLTFYLIQPINCGISGGIIP
jgi:hypothetical protein